MQVHELAEVSLQSVVACLAPHTHIKVDPAMVMYSDDTCKSPIAQNKVISASTGYYDLASGVCDGPVTITPQ